MGYVKTTAWPSRYAHEDEHRPTEECKVLDRTGKLYATFEVDGANWETSKAQREIALALGEALGTKAVYERNVHGTVYNRGSYTVGGWRVTSGRYVRSEFFELETMPRMLGALQGLQEHGYAPHGEFTINLVPERSDLEMIYNAYTILEARRQLIELALGFEDEAMLVVGHDLAFSIPLDAFSLPVIEACACLLRQVSLMAEATKKARMKPCDMSNPKYQMRSWLLRLGFIGEQFERPRQTLLEHLDGNAAFFDDAGKQKARDKRRQQKAMALA